MAKPAGFYTLQDDNGAQVVEPAPTVRLLLAYLTAGMPDFTPALGQKATRNDEFAIEVEWNGSHPIAIHHTRNGAHQKFSIADISVGTFDSMLEQIAQAEQENRGLNRRVSNLRSALIGVSVAAALIVPTAIVGYFHIAGVLEKQLELAGKVRDGSTSNMGLLAVVDSELNAADRRLAQQRARTLEQRAQTQLNADVSKDTGDLLTTLDERLARYEAAEPKITALRDVVSATSTLNDYIARLPREHEILRPKLRIVQEAAKQLRDVLKKTTDNYQAVQPQLDALYSSMRDVVAIDARANVGTYLQLTDPPANQRATYHLQLNTLIGAKTQIHLPSPLSAVHYVDDHLEITAQNPTQAAQLLYTELGIQPNTDKALEAQRLVRFTNDPFVLSLLKPAGVAVGNNTTYHVRVNSK